MISEILTNKGKGINFKYGSAIGRINTDESSFNEDLGTITNLYVNEANIFLEEMRNVVSPTIKLFSELITNNFNKNSVNLTSKYNLKLVGDVELFDLLKDDGKLSVIGNGLLPQGIMIGFPLDEKEDDMKSFFLTGENEIDNIVFPIINKYSNEELRRIWDVYMLDFSGTNTSLTELEYLHFKNVDKIVLIYCALHNILKGKMKYVLNSDIFEKNKVTVEDFIKNVINKYNNYIRITKDKNLVLNYSSLNNVYDIYVSGDLYNTYLEESEFGVDSIVGFVIDSVKNNGSTSVTLETIKEYGENYKNIYLSTYKMDQLKNARENIESRRNTLNVLAYNFIESIKTNFANNRIIKADLSKEFELNTFLKTIEEKELDNPTALSIKIVSFFNSEISEFISIMEAQNKFLDNKEDMSKEAALYAVIVRLINKLFDDVDLVDVKVD